MNHPKPEEWVPYLYGEATPEIRRQLRAHLSACPDCNEEYTHWKRSLGRLDAWKLPRTSQANELFVPFMRWAVAALILLATGFTVGHLSSRRPDVQALRAAIEPRLREELRQEMAQLVRDEMSQAARSTLLANTEETQRILNTYTAALSAQRETDSQSIRSAIQDLALQSLSLKKQLDTVAWNTAAGLHQAQQQLFQLADYKEPIASPKTDQN